MCLIINNNSNDPEKTIIADDGTGEDINIPSIFIGEEDGDKLLEYEEGILNIEFSINMSYDRVEYEIWTSSDSMEGMKFMTEFHIYFDKLINHTVFTPHYVTMNLPYVEDNPHCYCGGDYCSLDTFHEPPKIEGHTILEPGRQILDEDLVQLCIFDMIQDYGDTYSIYIIERLRQCTNLADLECSTRVTYIYIYIY